MFNLGAVWGIDVGDSALKAVKLKRAGKQIVLQDFQIVRYSEIGGEAGARREGLLPQAITALQTAGLKRDRCMVSIAPQTVFSRFISLPPVDKRRIPEIVLYEARQQIPFNLNEVIWAYESVRKEYVPGEEIEIGLFAVKREVIDAYLGELAPLWRQLHGIQVGPLGLYNFLRHEIKVEQPTVVIDIGAQSTDLLILDGTKFWLRNLPIAGNSFTSILEKRLNIPRAEAEKLKYGVADSRHRRKLLEVLRPVMRDLVAEIQRSVGYYKSLSQAVKFEEILVTGEGYQLFGLDKFLAEQLQYKITPLTDLKNIQYGGDAAREPELLKAMPSLAVAMGLALQGLGQGQASINLLPEDFIVRRELHGKRFSGLAAAALVWGIAVSFYMKETRTLTAMAELENAGKGTLDAVTRRQAEFEGKLKGKDPAKLDLYDRFGQRREFQARVIGAISTVIPTHIKVDQFKFSESGPVVGAGADENALRAARRRRRRRHRGGPGRCGTGEEGRRVQVAPHLPRDVRCGEGTDRAEEETAVGPQRSAHLSAAVEGDQGRCRGAIDRHEPAAASQAGVLPGGPGRETPTSAAPVLKAEQSAEITIGLYTDAEVPALLEEWTKEEARKAEEAKRAQEAADAAAKAGGEEAAKPPAKAAPGKAPSKNR